ncbi:hypothetical protein DUNSADRAFT_5855 [Dunaliella salina]|uniref:Uncharacterized protein n=1 Tax=Dunaliella salina TaxID=3046 RepID=A0ABQ7FU27_DUNSA|nr:hypothetical protein DUNSADRAFT_5855 [Dunaliella salina]|eukprot:KAF5825931.1 hypothetical protein DUNSADRAFT_5855 [Dunaliella salina]
MEIVFLPKFWLLTTEAACYDPISGMSHARRQFCHSSHALQVCMKVVTGQFSLFPAYLSSFFMYISLLEGKGLEGGLQRIEDCFFPTAATGMFFWPIANAINFRFVPPSKRLAYVNAAGIIWNMFLSWEISVEHKTSQNQSWVSTFEERSRRQTVEHL